MYAALEKWVLV